MSKSISKKFKNLSIVDPIPESSSSNIQTNSIVDVQPDVYGVPHHHVYTLRFLQCFLVSNDNSNMFVNTSDNVLVSTPNKKPITPYKVKTHLNQPNITNSSSAISNVKTSKSLPMITHRSDIVGSWNPKREKKIVSELDEKLHKIRSDINKLAPDNCNKLINRLCETITQDGECLTYTASLFFGEGLFKLVIRECYAKLSLELWKNFETISFQDIILEQCHKEFDLKLNIDEDIEDDVIVSLMKTRIHILYFMVELVKTNVLGFDSLELCIKKLAERTLKDERPNDFDICHVTEIILIIIPLIIESDKRKLDMLSPYCKIVYQHFKNGKLSTRSKFKVEDLIIVAKNNKLI